MSGWGPLLPTASWLCCSLHFSLLKPLEPPLFKDLFWGARGSRLEKAPSINVIPLPPIILPSGGWVSQLG